jgi:nitronate monooxygenase
MTHASLHTPLCDLLGIRHPIIQAGMAGATTPELVAAVSNAGGLGILGAARLTPEQLRQAIRTIRTMTAHPFGVNLVLAKAEPNDSDVKVVQRALNRFRRELSLPERLDEVMLPPSLLPGQMQAVFDEQVPVLSMALGDPGQWIASAHEAGARVMAMITTVSEARQVVESGVDIVVAQGSEAGGHRSTFELGRDNEVPLVGTMALVPQVTDAVHVPVVAAGGIADGRGLVAALALGAGGVQLGTRFLLALESAVFPAYQARVLSGTETDTVITRAFTGRPARSLRNRFLEQYAEAGIPPLAWPLQAMAADDIYSEARTRNDADHYPILAGQTLRGLKRRQRAADIIAELVSDAEAILRRLCSAT